MSRRTDISLFRKALALASTHIRAFSKNCVLIDGNSLSLPRKR
jgi:hypothetical protein